MVQIAVFIDWQNAYHGAREAFGLRSLPNEYGNFSPLGVGRELARRNGRGEAGQLVRVEIHRGLPDATRDRVGHGACRRQSSAWMAEAPEIVIPYLRPLRYPHDYPTSAAEEKGVDVQLALNAVECLIDGRCEVAIIVSCDSDLVPAIQTAHRLKKTVACIETASWSSPTYRRRMPRAPSGVFNNFLDEAVFRQVERCVNYAHKPTGGA